MNITKKQQKFVDEYLLDLNATQAAIRSGYSEKSASRIAIELLNKTHVAEAIQKAQSKRQKRTQVTSDYVLSRLVEIDQLDVLDIVNEEMSGFKPLSQWPKSWRTTITGIDVQEFFDYGEEGKELAGLVKKIKWPDKVKNLELIGKHIDIQAWRERKKVDVEDGQVVINIIDA